MIDVLHFISFFALNSEQAFEVACHCTNIFTTVFPSFWFQCCVVLVFLDLLTCHLTNPTTCSWKLHCYFLFAGVLMLSVSPWHKLICWLSTWEFIWWLLLVDLIHKGFVWSWRRSISCLWCWAPWSLLWSPIALADIWPDGPKGQSKAMDAYAAGYLGYACTCSWWCKDLGGVVRPPRPRPHFVRGKFTLALACPFAPIYSASACLSCCCSLGAATMLHALLSPFQFFFCISSSSSILALPYPI